MSEINNRREEQRRILDEMIADNKKSIDIARTILTEVVTANDEFTDLTDKQVVHLAILEVIANEIDNDFLKKFCERFKILRKSRGRQDRKEIVKMAQSLREEQEGIQSKLKDMLGVGN